MSRIKNIPLELSEVVKESNLIVEVECIEPFTEEVVVKGVDPNPPFIKKGFVFKVKQILKNSGKIEVPPTIRVPNEGWRRLLSQYKEKHSDGVSKSYEVKFYDSEVSTIKKADVLFLHQFQNTFELEARDSFESSEAMEKITMLIEGER
jgi:hypothetical protein